MPVYEPVRALERGLTILQVVNARDGLRTQEIAEITGLARPTVFRLLETLEGQGFINQSPSGGSWHPTLSCNLLSSGFLDKAWVGQIAVPAMVALGKEVLWPLDLVTLQGDAMQVRETTHKTSPFSFDVGMVGARIPILHTAGGNAYLAFCPDNEREEILEMMRQTGLPEHEMAHDPRAVAALIERTRQAGYGFRTEVWKTHTMSISFPIMSGDRVLASLTIICLKTAMTFDEMVRRFEEPLRSTCDEITRLLADRDDDSLFTD